MSTRFILLLASWLISITTLLGQEYINTLIVHSPSNIAGEYSAAAIDISSNVIQEPNLSGTLKLVEDDEDPKTDACTEPVNDLTDFIALVDRGACSFFHKAKNAVAAGSLGVIICNNIPGQDIFAPGGINTQISVPVVMISYEDCQTIKAELDNNVTVSFEHIPPPPCNPDCYIKTYPESTVWGNNGEGDFACGLGDWVVPGVINGFQIWQWNEDGVSTSGWGNVLPMPDSLGCNGSVVMEYALYEEFGMQYNDDLISPTIDLSGVTYPTLHFTSANLPLNSPFIDELGPRSSAFWTYSIDDGLTWQDTILLKSENIWNSNQTELRDGVLKETFILHEAANVENVRIKFIGYGDFYYWIIDDVYITDEVHPDLEADHSWFSCAPNFKTPTSQVDQIAFMMNINNLGNVDFDDCRYSVEISKDNTVIYSDSINNLGPIPANTSLEHVILLDTWSMLADTGTYSINYSVTADGLYADVDPTNNQQGNTFIITDSTFSKLRTEEEAGVQYMKGRAQGAGAYFTYANGYYIPNGGTETGPKTLTTGFGTNLYSVLGTTKLTGEVREWVLDHNNNGIVDLRTETRIIAQGQLILSESNPIDLRSIDIPLLPYDTESGRFDMAGQYLAIVHVAPLTSTNTQLGIGPLSSAFLEESFSEYNYHGAATDLAFKELGNSMGRLTSLSDYNGTSDNQDMRHLEPVEGPLFSWYLSMDIGYVEETTVSNTQVIDNSSIQFNVFPNPASDYIAIGIELLDASSTVKVQILDLSGKVVADNDFTDVMDQTLRINTVNISDGVYLVKVFTDSGVRSERVFIQK